MNLKSLQKIESKERILNVASRLFKKNGYSATGIDRVMHEAGLTAGGFYAHFKSKTDLLEQSIELSMRNSRELLIKGTEHLSGDEKIKVIMSRYVSFGHRDHAEKGCVLPALAAELYRGSKKSALLVTKYLNAWADFISQNLTEEITPEQKKEKALAMISQAVGAILLSRMVKTSHLSDIIILAAQK